MVALKKYTVAPPHWMLVLAVILVINCDAIMPVHADVTLVEQGKPVAVIVTADHPSDVTKQAVRELNDWLELITGAALPVARETDWENRHAFNDTGAGQEGVVVAIGPSSLTQASEERLKDLPPEAALVQISGQKVVLIGRDEAPQSDVVWRGTYYAVLELLQKRLGARWLWPGDLGRVYEKRQTVALAPGSWAWQTELTFGREMRNAYGGNYGGTGFRNMAEQALGHQVDRAVWRDLAQQQDRWLRWQRMNPLASDRSGESFRNWWKQFGQEHPDWFATLPEGLEFYRDRYPHAVKLCVSNPEVADKIIHDWKARYEQDPERGKILYVFPNDGRGFCVCNDCRAWDAPEMAELSDRELSVGNTGNVSDRYARFWNTLADRVTAVDPEAQVMTYVYRSYRQPPLHEEPRSNLIIGYVGGEGYYPEDNYDVRDEWQQWVKSGADAYWRPNLLHAGHFAPYLFAQQLAGDFKFLLEHRMIRTDFDSLTGAWACQGLNYYILAELHNRPEATFQELLAEYCQAFGPAAPQVRAYFEYWMDITQRGPKIMRRDDMVSQLTWGGWWTAFVWLTPKLYTPKVIDEGQQFLDQAANALADSDSIYAQRLTFLQQGLDHTRLTARTIGLYKKSKDSGSDTDRQIAIESLKQLKQLRLDLSGSLVAPVYWATALEEMKTEMWSTLGIEPL